MSITILINESQKKRLLVESMSDRIKNVIDSNTELVKKIVKDANKQLKLDIGFLLGWGASIGGFIGPINDFVQGKYPDLNDLQLSLILTGVLSTYFMDNKSLMLKLYARMKHEGIFEVFLDVIRKSDKLRDTFLTFLDSLGSLTHKISNMLSYTFIIPILPMIYNISTGGVDNDKKLLEIVVRSIGFVALGISGVAAKEIIRKIINRFRLKS